MIRTRFVFCLWISLLVFSAQALYADSLWDQAQPPYYGVSKRRVRVGDILTIYISESTTAVQEASTRTQKDSELGADMVNNWDQVANLLGNETLRKRFDFQIGGSDSFQGRGQTSRRSQVKAVVTSVITEILDTGNLYVVGEHKVKVNNEVETVRVAGIVRPADISAQNSVFSYQIAEAEVAVIGSGVVTSKQSPGVMTKMFNWLF